MKKTRVAILFLLLTLFAACLPAAAELPAQTTLKCLNIDRIHKLIGYVALGNRHCGLYKCTHCGSEGVHYSPSEEHSGGTETPTCTTGKTCALCGAKYGILGHDWDAWTSNGDGTHTRRCKRSNCDAVENESCSGGTGTFTCTKGKTCEKCGAEYGVLGHDWGAWTSDGDGTHGTHTRRCTRCDDARAATKRRPKAAAAARPAPVRECAPLAEGVTTAVTTGASGHPPATARTSATARTATKLILQAVPVAQRPAPPKRSVRRVVGNTAKKT